MLKWVFKSFIERYLIIFLLQLVVEHQVQHRVQEHAQLREQEPQHSHAQLLGLVLAKPALLRLELALRLEPQ
jgi:hypothetical protein